MPPRPSDEHPHPPGPERSWEESWHFDFVDAEGAVGGFVRLALRPAEGRAWYWAYLAGRGRALLAVRDHDVELPKGRALEVRGAGLWAQLVCETPLDHWSAGLEAFAVSLDDPTEAWRGERGDLVAFGLDLEWEAAAGAQAIEGGEGYAQSTTVHGDVLVGPDVVPLEGTGWRTHRWGPPPWSRVPWWWAGGHVAGGPAVCGGAPPAAGATGLAGDLARRSVATVGGLQVALTPVALAPVLLDRPDVALVRSLSSFEADGRTGWGWWEWTVEDPPLTSGPGRAPA